MPVLLLAPPSTYRPFTTTVPANLWCQHCPHSLKVIHAINDDQKRLNHHEDQSRIYQRSKHASPESHVLLFVHFVHKGSPYLHPSSLW